MSLEKINSVDIEIAVANMFGYRANIIVPNISWGAGLHECDLLIINKNNIATEVEIKISKSDLKADFKKKHRWEFINEMYRFKPTKCIKFMYYAVPENLVETAVQLLPSQIGILVVKKIVEPKYRMSSIIVTYYKCFYHRRAVGHKLFEPMADKQVMNIGRLAAMRIWSLKSHRKH